MIREATIEDLPKLFHLADEFYSSSKFLVDFNRDVFSRSWQTFMKQEFGTIFLLVHEEQIRGALGAFKYSDPNNGHKIAAECFWFVDPSYRGKGLQLLKRFESWANQEGCEQIHLVHLMDSMPEKLSKVYQHFGYHPAEILYTKEIPCQLEQQH